MPLYILINDTMLSLGTNFNASNMAKTGEDFDLIKVMGIVFGIDALSR